MQKKTSKLLIFLTILFLFAAPPLGFILLFLATKNLEKKKKLWIRGAISSIIVLVLVSLAIDSSSTQTSSTTTSSSTYSSSSSTSNATSSNDEETSTPTSTSTSTSTSNTLSQVDSDKNKIKSYIYSQFPSPYYTGTTVTNISVNEDLGTDVENDYVALVYLQWDVKNSISSTKEMLTMMSGNFAANIANNLPNVQELVLFWDVPYQPTLHPKLSYERKGTGDREGMYKMDFVW